MRQRSIHLRSLEIESAMDRGMEVDRALHLASREFSEAHIDLISAHDWCNSKNTPQQRLNHVRAVTPRPFGSMIYSINHIG
jgi:hypothetical protein